MQVHKERFEEVGEKDENGFPDYHYAGFFYRFVVGRDGLLARRYDDTPEETCFISQERKRRSGWTRQRFDAVPFDHPAFRTAVEYLLASEGVEQVKVLVAEYLPVDLDRIQIPPGSG